ncbi:MAG: DnaA regulatory inactivator Hda [Rhodocyclaceae bacterium]
MKQLPLDLKSRSEATFDDFVAGGNGEVLARLRALAAPGNYDMIYLWGAAGSGRSHLLAASAAAARAAGRPVWELRASSPAGEGPAPGGLVTADDVERLAPQAQIELFRAINTAPLAGLALLVAGAAPPAALALREDLKSRLAAMLVFELKPLSDEDKAEALMAEARGRGLRIERETVDYLLRRADRDLPSLLAVLDRLDRASLALKRAGSLALLREVLREGAQPGEPAPES